MKAVVKTIAGKKELEREAYMMTNTNIFDRSSAYSLIISAETNADDTMLEMGKKSWHENDEDSAMWNGFFWASLECLLADCPNDRVIAWFARRGIIG